jgi:hypothetical protein
MLSFVQIRASSWMLFIPISSSFSLLPLIKDAEDSGLISLPLSGIGKDLLDALH